jgi:hypothetical protein
MSGKAFFAAWNANLASLEKNLAGTTLRSHRSALMVLADHAGNKEGYPGLIAWPGLLRIAKWCDMTTRTARSSLRWLENKNLITLIENEEGGAGRRPTYRIEVDNLQALERSEIADKKRRKSATKKAEIRNTKGGSVFEIPPNKSNTYERNLLKKSLKESTAASGAAAHDGASPSAPPAALDEDTLRWREIVAAADHNLAMWLRNSLLRENSSGKTEILVPSRTARDQLTKLTLPLQKLLAKNGLQVGEVSIIVSTGHHSSSDDRGNRQRRAI